MLEPDVIVDGDGLVDGEELGDSVEFANIMIDDYLEAKTMHDTGDATFATHSAQRHVQHEQHGIRLRININVEQQDDCRGV